MFTDATACDTATVSRYPVDGADAGVITYAPSGCVATTASTTVSCSGTLLGLASLECGSGDWTPTNPTVSCFGMCTKYYIPNEWQRFDRFAVDLKWI